MLFFLGEQPQETCERSAGLLYWGNWLAVTLIIFKSDWSKKKLFSPCVLITCLLQVACIVIVVVIVFFSCNIICKTDLRKSIIHSVVCLAWLSGWKHVWKELLLRTVTDILATWMEVNLKLLGRLAFQTGGEETILQCSCFILIKLDKTQP